MSNFKSQLPSNLITNIIYFVINIIIGIWLVPYYISKLGVEGYGFIPLATLVTAYASTITMSFNSAVSRFLTINIQNKDTVEANKTFNTSFVISLLLVLALLPIAFGISYFSDSLFDIPVKLVYESKMLFFIVFLSFLITVLGNPFTASTYSLNRLDLSNIINIVNVLVRTALVVFLLYFFTPTLTSVGLSFLISAIVAMTVSYFICKKITPELKINFKFYDKTKRGSLTKMSSWLIINQIGTMLFVNIDLIVVNKIFGPFSAGQYAAILYMGITLRNLSFVVSRATGPMVYISYAKNEIKKIIEIMSSSVKFMSILLALPIGIMCGFALPFLKIWLGPDFVKYVPLLWLLTGHLVINLGVQPLYAVSMACNKVKVPAIVTLGFGIMNVVLAVVLSYTTNLGVYAVALAGAIVLTLKSGIFIPIYSAHVIQEEFKVQGSKSKGNIFMFVKPLLTGFILTFALFLCSYIFSHFVNIHSWKMLMIYSVLMTLPFLPIIWFYIIDKKERNTLKSIIVSRHKTQDTSPITNEPMNE